MSHRETVVPLGDFTSLASWSRATCPVVGTNLQLCGRRHRPSLFPEAPPSFARHRRRNDDCKRARTDASQQGRRNPIIEWHEAFYRAAALGIFGGKLSGGYQRGVLRNAKAMRQPYLMQRCLAGNHLAAISKKKSTRYLVEATHHQPVLHLTLPRLGWCLHPFFAVGGEDLPLKRPAVHQTLKSAHPIRAALGKRCRHDVDVGEPWHCKAALFVVCKAGGRA